MSIHTFAQKIKGWAGERRSPLLYIGILICTAVASFYTGYIAHLETHNQPRNQYHPLSQPAQNAINSVESVVSQVKEGTPAAPVTGGAYVASKNGTKYYPVSCSLAKRIKDANKVFFATGSDAEKQGYSLATNC